jgi:hypothetical protein
MDEALDRPTTRPSIGTWGPELAPRPREIDTSAPAGYGRDAMAALAQRGFRHEALFYASRDEFLERSLDFLQAGIGADEPTLVVLNRDKSDA